MFPLGDVSRDLRSFPFVTVLLILASCGVFYQELQLGEPFIVRWSVIPADVIAGRRLETLLTSAFLHGGWMHIIGNMIFFWAFAPPMEQAMGAVRFTVFYVVGALAAMAAHVYGAPDSMLPALGASGAIAAVMGAFMVTYPTDRIRTLILLPPFVRIVYIPAVILIGLWIGTQVLAVSAEGNQAATSGVAYYAHLGGAVFGLVAGRLFLR
jgi:membrane associated rhomboid family serine protease